MLRGLLALALTNGAAFLIAPCEAAPPSMILFCPRSDVCTACVLASPKDKLVADLQPSPSCEKSSREGGYNAEQMAFQSFEILERKKSTVGIQSVRLRDDGEWGFNGTLSTCVGAGGGACGSDPGIPDALGAVLSAFFGTPVHPQGKSIQDVLTEVEANVRNDAANLTNNYNVARQEEPELAAQFQRRAIEWRAAGAKATVIDQTAGAVIAGMPSLPVTTLQKQTGQALRIDEVRAEIAASLSLERVTPDAPDLVGGLQKVRSERYAGTTGLHRDIIQEEGRLTLAVKGNEMPVASAERAAAALRLARNFSSASTAESSQIAAGLLEEARTARHGSQGLVRTPQVAVVREDGKVEMVPQDSGYSEADTVVTLSTTIERRLSVAQDRIAEAGSSPLPTPISPEEKRSIVDLAQRVVADARRALYEGRFNDAKLMSRLGLDIADLATQTVPLLSTGRSVYELISGTNMFTHVELTAAERSLCALDIMLSLWGGKLLNSGVSTITSMAKEPERAKVAFGVAEKLVQRLEARGFGPKDITRDRLQHIADYHTVGGRMAGIVPINDKWKTIFNKDFDWVSGIGETVEKGVFKKGSQVPGYIYPRRIEAGDYLYTYRNSSPIGGWPGELPNGGSIYTQMVVFGTRPNGSFYLKTSFPLADPPL